MLESTETSTNDQNFAAGRQTPHLSLDGFVGPLEQLLLLARAQKLDLASLSLLDFIDQLAAAVQIAAAPRQKIEWVVMASWVLLLRSRLLIPISAKAQQEAQEETKLLQARLIALKGIQSLAAWLDARPQLGHDVFGRGAPELIGSWTETDYQIDVIEFLWATTELFGDESALKLDEVYSPPRFDLYAVDEARTRILNILSSSEEAQPLGSLVPPNNDVDLLNRRSLCRYKSGWTSTFAVALEMAKQGEVVLLQQGAFEPILIEIERFTPQSS